MSQRSGLPLFRSGYTNKRLHNEQLENNVIGKIKERIIFRLPEVKQQPFRK
jgi:hypothetical protein